MSDQALTFVIVFDYRGDRQRFWSGRRPVTEYPDAETYTSVGKGRAALGAAAAYLKGQRVHLVQGYGQDDETAVMVAIAEERDKRHRTGKTSRPTPVSFCTSSLHPYSPRCGCAACNPGCRSN